MDSAMRRLPILALTVAFCGALLTGGAEAGCLRHVHNRSPYTLVVTNSDGSAATVRPRSTGSIRLIEPGQVDVAAFCTGSGAEAPVLQRSFSYEAVQDRCFFEVGHRFFDRELGNGFLPRRADAPFALNNPRQGDLVLFSRGEACLPTR
jgi:hypothetical protein